MTVTLLRGDALHLPIADHTVDLVVTSPPYFGLRSYQDGGQHYAGQIGSEATPAEWVEAMLAATAEMVRVLKPCGSIWVNLGDKYSGGQPHADHGTGASTLNGHGGDGTVKDRGVKFRGTRTEFGGVPAKSLIGLPWRYAIACIDTTRGIPPMIVRNMVAAVHLGELDPDACEEIIREYEDGGKNAGLGLILRAEVIWSKPNGLPESVTDRVRRSHESWFHFTVQPRYFSAVDEIREAHLNTSWASAKRARGEREHQGPQDALRAAADYGRIRDGSADSGGNNPLGKLPGSVWSIPSQPLTVPPELGVDHFAAFPMEWPRRLIGGWSPTGICTGCGEGRRPVTEVGYIRRQNDRPGSRTDRNPDNNRNNGAAPFGSSALREASITGYVCACPDTTAPTTPAVVADVFGGTGTTALVAHVMGRHGISVDLSADYNRLAAWRTTDPGQLAQAAQVEKPPAQVAGQESLFDGFDTGRPPPVVKVDRVCPACGFRNNLSNRRDCEQCGSAKRVVTG